MTAIREKYDHMCFYISANTTERPGTWINNEPNTKTRYFNAVHLAVRICSLSQLQPALKTNQDADAHLNDAATGLRLFHLNFKYMHFLLLTEKKKKTYKKMQSDFVNLLWHLNNRWPTRWE